MWHVLFTSLCHDNNVTLFMLRPQQHMPNLSGSQIPIEESIQMTFYDIYDGHKMSQYFNT